MRSGTLEEVCTVTLHTANTAPSCSASTPACAAGVEPIDLRPLVTVPNRTLVEAARTLREASE